MGVNFTKSSAPIQDGTWTPALQGATDNPVPTYSKQAGHYTLIGKRCFFNITIVTTTMTKATLADEIRISLPFASVATASQIERTMLMLKNGTPVKDGNAGRITPSQSYVTVYQNSLTGGDAALTYGLTDIGVLTNTVTIEVSGSYEVA